MTWLMTIQTTLTAFTPPWRALRSARADPRDLKNRASRARDRGQIEKALGLYLELEQREPHDGSWSGRAAEMYRRLGQSRDAINALERAVIKYIQAGFRDKAAATCHLILRLDSNHEPAKELMATGMGYGFGVDFST